MERKFVIALFAVLTFAAFFGIYDAYKDGSVEVNLTQNEDNTEEKNIANDEDKTVVYIEGAVAKPGLVYIGNNARIGEVVETAGGLLANADIDNLNMADKVSDGQKITIPFANANETLTVDAVGKSDLININTATAEELQKLPRVGPATAKNIIDYREKNGNFKSIEDIKKVPRIGQKTFEKFRDMIRI